MCRANKEELESQEETRKRRRVREMAKRWHVYHFNLLVFVSILGNSFMSILSAVKYIDRLVGGKR
jgi:hypothetical protein